MHHGPPLEVADAVQELTGMGFYDVLPGVPAPADPADMDVIIPWGTPMKKIAVHVSPQPSHPHVCDHICIYV